MGSMGIKDVKGHDGHLLSHCSGLGTVSAPPPFYVLNLTEVAHVGSWGAGLWALSLHMGQARPLFLLPAKGRVLGERAYSPWPVFNTTWHYMGTKDFTG